MARERGEASCSMEIFVEARRNLSTKNDQDDDKSQPLRHVHGRATVGGGETTTVVISQGNKADDRTIGENGGVSHHSPRRIPRTAMIPVAVLSASAVLVLAFVCVSSLRESKRSRREHDQQNHQAVFRFGASGSSGSADLESSQLTAARSLFSTEKLRRSSLADGGSDRSCPYAITEGEEEQLAAAAAGGAATAATDGGSSSPVSSSFSPSVFSSFSSFPTSVSPSFVREGDDDDEGNSSVVTVKNFSYSRLGNRFISLARNLNLGFCCKSKLVSLPPKDDIIAPGVFNEGVPGPRWFDFSSAPDVEGFDASTCPESITWDGQDAFYLAGVRDEDHPYYTPGLFECVKSLPRLAGCEAAYLFPADAADVCLSDATGVKRENTQGNDKEKNESLQYDQDKLDGGSGVDGSDGSGEGIFPGVRGEPAVHENDRKIEEETEEEQKGQGNAPGVRLGWTRDVGAHQTVWPDQNGQQERGREEWGDENGGPWSPGRRGIETSYTEDITVVVGHERDDGAGEEWAKREGGDEEAGNLVVHVRSGDIFVDPAHPFYGQPPLQYYLRAMEHQRWDRIDVVTNGQEDEYHAINPVVPALEEKAASGELVGDIHFHKNRTMGEDLLSMLCGDGFVSAKSTVRHLVSRHSSATRMYFPHACDDTLRDLGNERPGVKVFGMVWQQEDYTVYQRWNNTQDQLSEIVTFAVAGFEECGDRQLEP